MVGYFVFKVVIDNFICWMVVELVFKFGEGMRVNVIVLGFFIGE